MRTIVLEDSGYPLISIGTEDTPMTTPVTAAGRALLATIAENERLSLHGSRIAGYVPAILAIEQEATEAARATVLDPEAFLAAHRDWLTDLGVTYDDSDHEGRLSYWRSILKRVASR